MQHREHQEQCAIFQWARMASGRYPELKYMYAVPNGHKMTKPQAARAVKEGMRSGVPDIVLPVPQRGYHGLYIELKVGYNKPTEHQKEFLDFLSSVGYKAVWVKGAEAAISVIEEYLGIDGWMFTQ